MRKGKTGIEETVSLVYNNLKIGVWECMKLRTQNIVVLMFCLFGFSGCGISQDNHEDVSSNAEMQETNAWESTQETDVEDTVVAEPGPEELLDAFLAGEIPAIYDNGEGGGSYLTSCRMMRMIGSVILQESGLTWIMMAKTSKL